MSDPWNPCKKMWWTVALAAALWTAAPPAGAVVAGTVSGSTLPVSGTVLPAAVILPVVALGEWRVLALGGGLFLARPTPGAEDPAFVYGYDGGLHKNALKLVAYHGGSDKTSAVEALAKSPGLTSTDLQTLKSFMAQLGWAGDGKAGSWKEMTTNDALDLAGSSNVGIFAGLIVESLSASTNFAGASASVSVGYCKAATLIDKAATSVVVEASLAASTEATAYVATEASTQLFTQTAAQVCADIFPTYPPPGPPAFPFYPPGTPPPPGWTPPSGPGAPVWVGGTCTAFGSTAQCVNRNGQLCNCSCQGAGATGLWVSTGGCIGIPSTTPGTAGPPPVPGSPCTPAGGVGPCGNQCACNCTPAPGAPPGTPGTWSPTIGCAGFEEAGYGLILLTGLLGFILAKRSRRGSRAA
ncbi:MAG: hypothetical protein ACJ75H_01275 [Thermoanaerobaculia bacterium]